MNKEAAGGKKKEKTQTDGRMSARERGKMAKRRAKWQPAVVREKGKGTRSQDGENWGRSRKWGVPQTAANSHANCARKKTSKNVYKKGQKCGEHELAKARV